MCAPDWLALREDADAAARSPELADRVRIHLGNGPVTVRDLGCGTGAMGRWLAPRLPGPQRWVLHDRDPVLLARAAAHPPAGPVTVQTTRADLTTVAAADLADTSLVTASALLDLLTADEVDALAAACVDAGCAALWTLSVAGRVEIDPPEPLDVELAAAFDAHQRRRVDGRRLLGPDAGAAATDAFTVRGAAVELRPSPWRLAARGSALVEEWLRGWIDAACAQSPALERHADAYLRRRLDTAAVGALRVEVGHVDVLALPAGAP
ncbi:MAG: class I SAM-dependent methyltransferase [Pseudonocardia sp.]|nr:class I SAM-dependent methyltransferase [Pseudonocardia sp.]